MAIALQWLHFARFVCVDGRVGFASPLQSKGPHDSRMLTSSAFFQCEAAAPAVPGGGGARGSAGGGFSTAPTVVLLTGRAAARVGASALRPLSLHSLARQRGWGPPRGSMQIVVLLARGQTSLPLSILRRYVPSLPCSLRRLSEIRAPTALVSRMGITPTSPSRPIVCARSLSCGVRRSEAFRCWSRAVSRSPRASLCAGDTRADSTSGWSGRKATA